MRPSVWSLNSWSPGLLLRSAGPQQQDHRGHPLYRICLNGWISHCSSEWSAVIQALTSSPLMGITMDHHWQEGWLVLESWWGERWWKKRKSTVSRSQSGQRVWQLQKGWLLCVYIICDYLWQRDWSLVWNDILCEAIRICRIGAGVNVKST